MLDKVILSANEDPTYIEFWPAVAWAYKQLFPDVEVHLAFLSSRSEDDPYVADLRSHGSVTLFPPVADVPEFAQAKMIRFILAFQQGEKVCYVDDIDLIPLQREFITDKLSKRPAGHLLCVGGEVYDNNGCYPASQMTAEGTVWKAFINPDGLTYENLIRKFRRAPLFDRREDVCIPLDWSKDDYFSDERLLRRLIHDHPVPKFELARGYESYLDATIDRHTYDSKTDMWNFDVEKLKAGGYVNVHGLRPFGKHEKKYGPIIEYIREKFQRPNWTVVVNDPTVHVQLKKDLELRSAFLRNVTDWDNHRHLLWLALEETGSGPVVEMGCGDGSTPFLHDYCAATGRTLYSFETDLDYIWRFRHLESDTHKIIHVVNDWHIAKDIYPNPSVVLIDHAPGERRIVDVKRFADIDGILVLHDTQPQPTAADYGWEKIWHLFKYRVDLSAPVNEESAEKHNRTWASAVSNKYDVSKWKGQTFGEYKLI